MKTAVLTLLVVAVASSALAADPVIPDPQRRTVLSFVTGFTDNDVEIGRTFLGGKYTALAFVGYLEEKFNDPGGTSSLHALNLGVQGRRNFAVSDQIRPFAFANVFRTSSSHSGPCSEAPNWAYGAGGGAEYFFSPRVSFEGTAGLAYGRTHETCSGDAGTFTTSTKALNTFRSGIAINFYF